MVLYNLHYRLKRWRDSKRATGSPLALLYQSPPFRSRQLFFDTRFLVVDCEMSGLDPRTNHLLSIGWVVVERGRVNNATAKHFLIHAEKGVGDSIRIHGLHDSNIAGAKSPAAVLLLLIQQMLNSVVVFHHAPIDVQFLQRASEAVFRCPLLLTCVDTMAIEKRRLQLQGKNDSLRLVAARKRYGLPEVKQHNALTDAIATAELLLAQASYIGHRETLQLGYLPLQVF